MKIQEDIESWVCIQNYVAMQVQERGEEAQYQNKQATMPLNPQDDYDRGRTNATTHSILVFFLIP